MATNLRQSLQERARQANIGGDIRYGQYHTNLRKKVEGDLSRATDKAKREAERGDKAGDWMNLVKMLSSFTPYGAAINTALSAADLGGDVWRGMKGNIPTMGGAGKYAGTAYEQFYKQNLQNLNEQIKGARKGKLGKSLISNLLNIGSQNILPGGRAVDEMGFEVAEDLVGKTSILDAMRMQVNPATWDTIQDVIPGLRASQALSKTSVPFSKHATWGDLYLSGAPLASSLLRKKQTATSPMAPGYRRPDIRRRIR